MGYGICRQAEDHDCVGLYLNDVETSRDYGIHHQAFDHVLDEDVGLHVGLQVASMELGMGHHRVPVAWSVEVVSERVG